MTPYDDLLARHVVLEEDGELHPDGCFYCGGLHLTSACPDADDVLWDDEYDDLDDLEDLDDLDDEEDLL